MFSTAAWQRISAAAAAIGAILLWVAVVGRIAQMLTLYWKVGDANIEGGHASLSIFVVTALALGTFGLLLARATAEKLPQHVSRGAGIASLCAGATWIALVLSPLVRLVPR